MKTRKKSKTIEEIPRNPKTGQYTQTCGCKDHIIFCEFIESEKKRTQFRKRPYFAGRASYNELESRRLVETNVSAICIACLEYANDNFVPKRRRISTINEDRIMELEIIEEFVKEVNDFTIKLHNIQWSKASSTLKQSLSNLSKKIGFLVRDSIQEASSKENHTKSLESLTRCKQRDWYKQQNGIVKGFIEGCTGITETTSSDKKMNAAVHVVEQLMQAKNVNAITPFALQRNIVSYNMTNSKTVVQLYSSWESSGSYSTIDKLLKTPSPPISIPKGDLHLSFDNNQKVGKHSGRIKIGSKQPLSICTTVGVIQPQPVTDIQSEDDLHPKIWSNKLTSSAAIEKINDREAVFKENFQRYRGKFIDECIDEIASQQFQTEYPHMPFEDFVDSAVMNPEKHVCYSCYKVYSNDKSCCPDCRHDPNFHPAGFDKYHRTESKVAECKPNVRIAEPCMVNPSSVETVYTVLEHIRQQAIVEERKWTFVHCDGVPYVYAAEIQDKLLRCIQCGDLLPKEEKEIHSKSHNDATTFENVFADLVLRVGPGHFEMNMAKSILKFTWSPFTKHFATLLGFRTPKSHHVVMTGIDHHRSRQILEASLGALSRELLVPYVRFSLINGIKPTSVGYADWVNERVECQKYMFIYHVTFAYLLAFHLYNEGVRKNNSDAIMAARTTFAPLFYISHHPKYQHLHLRDLVHRVAYPDKLESYVKSNESFSRSGKCNKAQGADFIHEEIPNRLVKSFLGPGMPTEETWTNICRKATILKEIKANIMGVYGDESDKVKEKRFEHETLMMRREFRLNGYLGNPTLPNVLKSIDGATLDGHLCDFVHVAKSNYEIYKNTFANNGDYIPTGLAPVFITPEDRRDYNMLENKTMDYIRELTLKTIEELHDESLITENTKKLKKIKKKDHLISNYYELCDLVLSRNTEKAVIIEEEGQEEKLMN